MISSVQMLIFLSLVTFCSKYLIKRSFQLQFKAFLEMFSPRMKFNDLSLFLRLSRALKLIHPECIACLHRMKDASLNIFMHG